MQKDLSKRHHKKTIKNQAYGKNSKKQLRDKKIVTCKVTPIGYQWILTRNPTGQERVEWYIQSVKRK